MSSQDTIRLLVINDSQAEVERLLSMLRNAGRNTRAQHVPSREGLEKLLTEQVWDMLIGIDNARTCNVKEAIRSIKKLDKDVPVIIQADVGDDTERTVALIDGLKAGARDVVVLDDDQHLLLVMDRELQNLAERRERRTTDRKFNATERRCQQLLDSSRDAIAYVEDGMFLYLNRSFSEMFGYNDPDDLLVMPMVDVLSEQDQDAFVQFMKNFKLVDTSTAQELKVKAINVSGQEFEAAFTVTHATYDEEACVQLLVEGIGAAAVAAPVTATASSVATASPVAVTPSPAPAAAKPTGIDPVTGLQDRRSMMTLLANAIQEAAEKNHYRSLYYISIDRFAQHRTNLGIANTDAMLASLAGCLKTALDADAVLAHFNSEEFMLLANGIDSDQHLKKATELCKKVEAYICSAGTKSVQVTISVGIAPISENATNPDEILKRAHLAADEARAEGRDGVGSRAKVYAPKISSGDADASAILEVIRHALSNEAIHILFQPIISLQGEPEEHYEVFVRILDGAGKALDTTKMFRAVEADREIACKLDRAIILGATRLLALHRAKGHDTRLLFNLTTASILDSAALVPWLGITFKAGNIPAEAAIFQISEGDATNYLTQAKTFTDALRSLGSQSAIKHFGCSLDPFKTLSHLSNVSLVKVDGSFSTDIQKKSEDSKALKALVKQLGESGKKAIIPFVENATMMALVWQTGAHFIQGHYLQAPAREMSFQFSDE
jgi:diguanylate cyclase (GGDEF)-like protein/PAS domain S-box-containing protein